ncbi:hypothetical protein GCM10022218_02270 [Sphingobacterium ginsenosidimutans]|uniref:Uncharacterized protein n=1 Tax=Sphingobacterium ginsenosidimutans TaxID=687845 RepID=A0ABP7ZQJ7_9SPHI
MKASYTKNKAFNNQCYPDLIFRASRKIKKRIIRPWNVDEKTKGSVAVFLSPNKLLISFSDLDLMYCLGSRLYLYSSHVLDVFVE